ncbi:uncharacterized protein SPPG_02411 [Spizellomyces punctatus DAOM BR117]|uniref:Uncharacterized protein n=1 Tax=Spizellomyces punctatus (strain DAOM BR117) TaxID=645134 RepID=A0A0L0HQM6_SPIPD|nr:uncharacterized protein SPPG_02411 [Spizellomyces punctatus DAOM BR117]KND03368.1 hypothetical protein SPPG_02411 [Spizellomyces punctatus DAOM BR117]|eukprot:XP_016611407.1 hypothetical protein SPPG_02411 [Spizellomyces punctatus DAOM BR117]
MLVKSKYTSRLFEFSTFAPNIGRGRTLSCAGIQVARFIIERLGEVVKAKRGARCGELDILWDMVAPNGRDIFETESSLRHARIDGGSGAIPQQAHRARRHVAARRGLGFRESEDGQQDTDSVS